MNKKLKKNIDYIDIKIKGGNKIKRYPTKKFYNECVKDIRKRLKCINNRETIYE